MKHGSRREREVILWFDLLVKSVHRILVVTKNNVGSAISRTGKFGR